jgi:hypothetical protein
MPPRFVAPPHWTSDELRASRLQAEALFKAQRREEGPMAFSEVCTKVEPIVRNALHATDDLLSLTGDIFLKDPLLFQTLRNFCGPPISEEDLWTLVGGPKFKRVPPDYAEDTAEVISLVIDRVRFPWVETRRRPSTAEVDTAVLATTVLLATRMIGTSRRGASSARQEAAVGDILESARYKLDPARTPIQLIDELDRGCYSRERKVAEAKCDVPVRLLDGRLLAIECKVSNGPKNGWKRLNREVGGKSETWRLHFGTQVITAVVLAGVLDLSCLEATQAQHVALFWEHDLKPLAEFIASAI